MPIDSIYVGGTGATPPLFGLVTSGPTNKRMAPYPANKMSSTLLLAM
jgi:hypothetical protein